MNGHCCGGEARRGPSRWRRSGEVAGWIIPSVTLVFLPKCPVCVAAYVALFSGIGLSVGAAGWLRMAILVSCAALLMGLSLRRLILLKRPPQSLG